MAGNMTEIQKAKGKNQNSEMAARALPASVFHFCLFTFAFCLLPFSSATANEVLRDPTRPPAALYTPDGWGEIETGPVLQSVRISQGRYTAVISGETVRVGSRYGEARVIRIRETEVVLKTGDSLQTLKLFPDVEKRPAANNRRSKR